MKKKTQQKAAITSLKQGSNFFEDLLATQYSPIEDTQTKQENKKIISNSSQLKEIHLQKDIVSTHIDPTGINLFQYKDRPEEELGDIDALATDIKLNGQAQPCIVRPTKNGKELIIGERRWRAALKGKIKLWVIIKEMSDDQASILQAIENIQREDLSDYAKGISYKKLLQNKILTQQDLQKRLQMSQKQLTRYLAFSDIPEKIWAVINNKTKITARTAIEIRTLANKGPKYIDALIELAPLLSTGKLGSTNIYKKVDALLNKKTKPEALSETFRDNQGKLLYVFKQDKNKNITLRFNKKTRNGAAYESLKTIINQAVNVFFEELSRTGN